MRILVRTALALVLSVAFVGQTPVSAQVPTPESVLGHKPGDDYYLANYDEALNYFRKLEASSKKIRLIKVGKTSRGLDWYMAQISSEANLAKIERNKQIWQQLANVRGLNDQTARALAKEGKILVHIDSGLHSTEAAPAQHAIQLAYNLLSAQNDPEIEAILDNVVLQLWFNINPDGTNMMVNWYRKNVGTPYEVAPMIELYQEYVGHDNNRDGYMNNTLEQQVITKTMLEWHPVIIYNHHQSAPFPTRIWIPPYAEPISDNVHPSIYRWTNVFGTSMAAYLDDHGMPGAVHRGNGFDNWYPGFVDAINMFRNATAFLTETALYQYATPKFYTLQDFPTNTRKLKAEVLYSSPWKGGWWRLKDAVDYCIGASMAVLNVAAKNREQLLYNKYQVGRDTIARFSKDAPYAWVIPAEQADTPTAAVLVEKLLINGVEVHQAAAPVELDGVTYPAGSWVALLDQPFGAMVKELFERQEYPDIRDTPGGAPDLPYDVAGWTLPLQMGVDAVRIDQPVPANIRSQLKKITKAAVLNAGVSGSGSAYATSWQQNHAARAAFELLKKKANVQADRKGSQLIVSGVDRGALEELGTRLNLTFKPTTASGTQLEAKRVGIYRPWVPNIDEGWTRWLFDTYGYSLVGLRDSDMRAGRLDKRIDVLIIADNFPGRLLEGHAKGTIPDQYAGGMGQTGVEALRDFVQRGGTLITFNQASMFAIQQLQLPVKNVLDGVKNTEFFCSGSILRTQLAAVDHPIAAGLPAEPAVMFERSPAFELTDAKQGKVILNYAKGRNSLMSGFLLGPEKLYDKAALLEVNYGKGRVILFGFRPQWRGQSHGMFKAIFNSVLLGADTSAAPTDKSADKAKEKQS